MTCPQSFPRERKNVDAMQARAAWRAGTQAGEQAGKHAGTRGGGHPGGQAGRHAATKLAHKQQADGQADGTADRQAARRADTQTTQPQNKTPAAETVVQSMRESCPRYTAPQTLANEHSHRQHPKQSLTQKLRETCTSQNKNQTAALVRAAREHDKTLTKKMRESCASGSKLQTLPRHPSPGDLKGEAPAKKLRESCPSADKYPTLARHQSPRAGKDKAPAKKLRESCPSANQFQTLARHQSPRAPKEKAPAKKLRESCPSTNEFQTLARHQSPRAPKEKALAKKLRESCPWPRPLQDGDRPGAPGLDISTKPKVLANKLTDSLADSLTQLDGRLIFCLEDIQGPCGTVLLVVTSGNLAPLRACARICPPIRRLEKHSTFPLVTRGLCGTHRALPRGQGLAHRPKPDRPYLGISPRAWVARPICWVFPFTATLEELGSLGGLPWVPPHHRTGLPQLPDTQEEGVLCLASLGSRARPVGQDSYRSPGTTPGLREVRAGPTWEHFPWPSQEPGVWGRARAAGIPPGAGSRKADEGSPPLGGLSLPLLLTHPATPGGNCAPLKAA